QGFPPRDRLLDFGTGAGHARQRAALGGRVGQRPEVGAYGTGVDRRTAGLEDWRRWRPFGPWARYGDAQARIRTRRRPPTLDLRSEGGAGAPRLSGSGPAAARAATVRASDGQRVDRHVAG